MTLWNKLINNSKHRRATVIKQTNDGKVEFTVFSTLGEEKGEIRHSDWYDSEQDALKNIGRVYDNYESFTRGFGSRDREIIRTIPFSELNGDQTVEYKKGDKVRLVSGGEIGEVVKNKQGTVVVRINREENKHLSYWKHMESTAESGHYVSDIEPYYEDDETELEGVPLDQLEEQMEEAGKQAKEAGLDLNLETTEDSEGEKETSHGRVYPIHPTKDEKRIMKYAMNDGYLLALDKINFPLTPNLFKELSDEYQATFSIKGNDVEIIAFRMGIKAMANYYMKKIAEAGYKLPK